MKHTQEVSKIRRFSEQKKANLYWYKKWNTVLDWNFKEPNVRWYGGGKLNITENCLDRHLKKKGEHTAITWVPNNPKEKSRLLTYRQLHEEVCKFSNVLRSIGAKKGDRICLYMPMVPELAIAVLACARIGAIHSVVFAGFSAQSLADRINDAKCNIVVTADGAFRGSKMIALKEIVDEGLQHCSTVDKVIVLERTKQSISMQVGRDVWWHEQMLTVSRIRPAGNGF